MIPPFLSFEMLNVRTPLSGHEEAEPTGNLACLRNQNSALGLTVAHTLAQKTTVCKPENRRRGSLRREDNLRPDPGHFRSFHPSHLSDGEEIPCFAFHPARTGAQAGPGGENLPDS